MRASRKPSHGRVMPANVQVTRRMAEAGKRAWYWRTYLASGPLVAFIQPKMIISAGSSVLGAGVVLSGDGRKR